MTYSSGGLIQATDYNGFASTTSGANINAVWGTATSTSGYGQGNIATVSAAATVTATQWATLNNTIAATANHQGTSITSRTNPTAGDTISILSNINTDITNLNTNQNNAYAVGSQFTGWTGTTAKTTSTGSGGTAWTLTFTHTVTFANTTALYSFFNAGGYVQLQFGKTSTGTNEDTAWNAFVGNGTANGVVGRIVQTGAAASKTIAGSSYTGTTKFGGSGTPTTLATSTGVYALTGSPTTIYKQFDSGAAYAANYVQINASISGAVLTYTTTWFDDGTAVSAVITGGTAPTGATFGTAPTTLCTYYPPETTYLSNTWGTPTVAATVS
jgi:hypothetical protein